MLSSEWWLLFVAAKITGVGKKLIESPSLHLTGNVDQTNSKCLEQLFALTGLPSRYAIALSGWGEYKGTNAVLCGETWLKQKTRAVAGTSIRYKIPETTSRADKIDENKIHQQKLSLAVGVQDNFEGKKGQESRIQVQSFKLPLQVSLSLSLFLKYCLRISAVLIW